ncbi:MAG: radical SAM-associated putative lipoprotein [Bacteroidales bacterium]|nr:radical SAM-associated putative lipoprotein [Bacteroidales bacterium]
MKKRLSLWWEALTGGILTLLGFSGCDAIQHIVNPPVEYGMPHANYKVLGDVTDPDGKPIEGIRVIFAPYGNPVEEHCENDTLHTDSKGHFELDKAKFMFGWVDENISFLAEDVDGNENGSFKSKEIAGKDKVSVTKVKEGDGRWYTGDYEISTQITLEENAE